MRKFASLLAVLFLFVGWTFGQNQTITGSVKTAGGNAVPFASIQVKETRNGTIADEHGVFSIKAKIGETLIISASGFSTKEVAISTSSVQVTLDATGGLSEVVVTTTALGIKRASKEIGYSTANISASSITESKSFNLAQALTNKVSGLVVYNTSASVNASPRVLLRGLRSMTGDNTALVVLDGVAVPSNTLNYINPNDVESVSIMKGGQAATLFGSDGVNGAIIINTKKGSKRPEITVSNSFNVEQLAYLPKFQEEFGSGSAYGANLHEDFHPAENQQYGDAFDGSLRHPGRVLQDGSYLTYPYSFVPGVRKNIWNTGQTNQTDISYRAGNEASNIYTSYQRVQTSGIVPGDRYERNALRLNASNTYKRLTISFDATYTWDKTNRTTTDYYFYSLNVPGWIPINDFRDWKNNPFGDLNGYFNDYYLNPYWLLDNNRSQGKNNYFNGNITAKYKINDALNLNVRIGIANTEGTNTNTANPYTYSTWSSSTSGAYLTGYNRDYDYVLTGAGFYKARSPIPGSMSESYSYGNRINGDAFATYNKNFGDFSLKTVLGDNVQIRRGKNIGVSTSALTFPDYFNLVNSATGLYTGSDSRSEQRKTGAYLDATLGYRGYLFLHGTARHDWTSVFYKENRDSKLYQYTTWGADASFSVLDAIGYKSDVLSYAKVRASYNINRNDNIGPYNLDQTYGFSSGFPFSGLIGMGTGGSLPFSSLTAEKVSSAEAGIELGFWKNRITLEASYYRQIADQQILSAAVSPATGIQSILTNAAKVRNHGLDGELKMNLIHNRDWNLNLDFNYTYNTNRVTDLYVDGFTSLQYQTSSNLNLNAELNKMFPYLKVTYFNRDSASGKVIVDPSTGWPTKASGLEGVGNTMPKQLLGVNLNVSWKGFSLEANAEYRGDYVIYNALGEDMMFTGTSAISTIYHRQQFIWPNSVYYDAGSSKYLPNDKYAVSQYYGGYYGFGDLSNGSSLHNVGETFFSSGDFWKLRVVTLSYDFNTAKLGNFGKVVKGLTISAWGRNLKTWLAADNWFTDPEFSNTNGNSIGINTTGNTPPTRQFGGTIKVVF
ncbi:MAG TPA: SusC/RagA family TonB-linked outer membrane protein [Chitinophagaceae bacterium]|nr:SusC/RagA family TonB-linked outer membrane protein [Chitinophagaceae bacterium]